MRTLHRIISRAVPLLLAAGCAPADPWVWWPAPDEVMLGDLQVARTGWERGRETDPGDQGQDRYTWAIEVRNTSGTIWSGQIRIIAELSAGGATYTDTLTERIVVPGRRTITVSDFGRMTAGETNVVPRFAIRIGRYCATIQGTQGEAQACPEEPAEEPPTDVGPPIG